MRVNFFYLSLMAYITIIYLAVFTGFDHSVLLGILLFYILAERLFTQLLIIILARASRVIYDRAKAAGVDFSDLQRGNK